MSQELRIVSVEKPEEEAWGLIGQGINEYNLQRGGPENFHRLCFVLQSPTGSIEGGVIAQVYWDWLYVDLMWIKEEHRGRGYGSRILSALEAEAKKLGAKNVYLDTFSFQAPDFYKKHGYHIFGELPNFPAGHQRYFLTKSLAG